MGTLADGTTARHPSGVLAGEGGQARPRVVVRMGAVGSESNEIPVAPTGRYTNRSPTAAQAVIAPPSK
jgi:hypothetical protein